LLRNAEQSIRELEPPPAVADPPVVVHVPVPDHPDVAGQNIVTAAPG
jgi:hypothetical protein